MPPGTVCLQGSVTELDLTRATVSHSNLGGAGPDNYGKEVLKLTRVGTQSGVYFDLEVSAQSVYQAFNASSNGIAGSFGQINVAAGTSCELEFTFKDSDTHAPMVLDSTVFTVYNLETGTLSRSGDTVGGSLSDEPRVAVTASGYDKSRITNPKSEVTETTLSDGDERFAVTSAARPYELTSTVTGLNTPQLKRIVMLTYSRVSSFRLRFSVKGGSGGYDFTWAGIAAFPRDAACPRDPPPPLPPPSPPPLPLPPPPLSPPPSRRSRIRWRSRAGVHSDRVHRCC